MYIYDLYIHRVHFASCNIYILTSDFEIHDIFLGFLKKNRTYFFKATTSEKTRHTNRKRLSDCVIKTYLGIYSCLKIPNSRAISKKEILQNNTLLV